MTSVEWKEEHNEEYLNNFQNQKSQRRFKAFDDFGLLYWDVQLTPFNNAEKWKWILPFIMFCLEALVKIATGVEDRGQIYNKEKFLKPKSIT